MSKLSNSDEKDYEESPVISLTDAEAGGSKQHGSKDIALQALEDGIPEWTPAEERAVLWKIDTRFLPWLTLAFLFQFLDKTAVSYSALWGLQAETGLVGNEYANLQTFFYVGYIIFEAPVNLLMQRVSISKVCAFMIFSWGAILLGMTAASNYTGLVIARVLLGAAEAGITPAFIHMTGMFYTRDEQPMRLCIWFMMNGVSAIVGGPIAFGIGKITTGLATYKYPFLIYGALTTVFSVFFYLFICSNPMEAKWLDERQKKIAVARLASNMTGIDNKEIKKYQIKEAFTDPKTWFLAIFCMSACIANSGLTAFGPLILNGFGFSKFQTTLLGMPAGATQVVGMVFIGYVAGRWANTRSIMMVTGSIVALIGACIVYALPKANQTGRLMGYYLIPVYITSFVLSLNHIQANVAGRTKKSTVGVIWFVANCTGNLIGPQCYLAREAPIYSSGFISMIVSISSMIISSAGLYFWLKRENKQKAAKLIALGLQDTPMEERVKQSFMDLTDRENPYFVYLL